MFLETFRWWTTLLRLNRKPHRHNMVLNVVNLSDLKQMFNSALLALTLISQSAALSVGTTIKSYKFQVGVCDSSCAIPLRLGATPQFTVADDEKNVLTTVQNSSLTTKTTYTISSI